MAGLGPACQAVGISHAHHQAQVNKVEVHGRNCSGVQFRRRCQPGEPDEPNEPSAMDIKQRSTPLEHAPGNHRAVDL